MKAVLAILLLGLLASCSGLQVHLHDRHVQSSSLIEAFAGSHPGTTLVLFDRHHDIGSTASGISSSNWVAGILERRLVTAVVWVPAATLLSSQRASRAEWLQQSIRRSRFEDTAAIECRISLANLDELRSIPPASPLIVSLDLDVLDQRGDIPPTVFLDDITAWIVERHPRLVTVALSAAYQRDPAVAWKWIERFADAFPYRKMSWFLETGSYAPSPEGHEELAAWNLWKDQPETFGPCSARFLPGPALWIVAPGAIRESLLNRGTRAGDPSAADILSGWKDSERRALEQEFPCARRERLMSSAIDGLEEAWSGVSVGEPPPGIEGRGMAVRFLNRGMDRGCLALYARIGDPDAAARYCAQSAAYDPRYAPVRPEERQDLEVEVSMFGPWHDMKDAMDFRPGLDSVLLRDGERITLLQASLAAERLCDRDDFLRILARKAGLGEDGWKDPSIAWRRAVTISFRRPVASARP